MSSHHKFFGLVHTSGVRSLEGFVSFNILLLTTLLLSTSCSSTAGESDLNNDPSPTPQSTNSITDQSRDIFDVDVKNDAQIDKTRQLNCWRSKDLSRQATDLDFEAMRVARTDRDLQIQLTFKSSQLRMESYMLGLDC